MIDIEKERERTGYRGKPQQWQYGFDLAMNIAKAQLDALEESRMTWREYAMKIESGEYELVKMNNQDFNYPAFSVLGLDIAVQETDVIIEDEHYCIVDVQFTNSESDTDKILANTIESHPKAIVVNNHAIHREFLRYQIEKIKKDLDEEAN